MFEIDLYNKEVIKAYLERKSAKELNGIESMSRANLRNLLLRRLANGELKEDIATLNDIFNPFHKYHTLEGAIKKEEDKFRPLQYFFTQKTNKPSDNAIKLLAILIDFQPRSMNEWISNTKSTLQEIPIVKDAVDNKYENSYSSSLVEGLKEAHEGEGDIDLIMEVGFERIAQEEEVGINKETDKKTAHFDSTASVINTSSPILRKQTNRVLYPLSVVGFAIVLSLALYFWSRSQCMCWQVDQYVAVDCDAEIIGAPIIALNADKLKNFKKINRPDTLTEEHVYKVWYSKISNKVEFFTGPGLHPVHNHSALKAATKHIINTYATKNTANGRSIQH